MKRFLLLATISAISMVSFAQADSNWGANSKSKSSVSEGWSSFYVQYNPSKLVVDTSGDDDQSFTGITVGYNRDIGITYGTPIYLEVGVAAQYSFVKKDGYLFDDDDDYDFEMSWNMGSIKVPLSLTYDWEVSPAVSIAPYAGLTARFNIFGNMSAENDYDDKSVNIFDKKDMGSKEAVWKRFQIGWQIGVNLKFNETWYLGASYGTDFSEVCKKIKIAQPALSIGFIF